MKIRFVTLGCKLNFAESSAIGKALLEKGHTRAKQGEEADICVINTCSVTDNADHKDRQAIHRIKRQNPNAIIIVTGCYAQLQPQQVSEIEGVDYVLGQNEKYSITQLVNELCDSLEDGVPPTERPTGYSLEAQKIRVANIREVEEFHGVHSGDDRTRCFIKVQDGCNYFCTYCTIPYARGKSRNPLISEIIKDAQQALAQGAKELILTGVNIGDFGRSTGETFLALLRALDSLEDGVPPIGRSHASELQVKGERLEAKGMDYRIRISSCEPNLLTDEIIDFVAQSKHFAPHFHIPLQSGSNEVLKIMGRRYTRELFEERINHIKQVMPYAFIGVDCMVGVRGEKEEYFEEYIEFIKRLDVSQLHVFTYSERANTKMLELDVCIVPKAERQHRSKVLHAISEEKTKKFYEQNKGREAVVLWESKKEGDMMAGFTENYVKVHRPYDKKKVNCFEKIKI
jgi:threonylcarbamoyladenosine tRNA methylthiotransferase MtaB